MATTIAAIRSAMALVPFRIPARGSPHPSIIAALLTGKARKWSAVHCPKTVGSIHGPEVAQRCR